MGWSLFGLSLFWFIFKNLYTKNDSVGFTNNRFKEILNLQKHIFCMIRIITYSRRFNIQLFREVYKEPLVVTWRIIDTIVNWRVFTTQYVAQNSVRDTLFTDGFFASDTHASVRIQPIHLAYYVIISLFNQRFLKINNLVNDTYQPVY